MVKSEQTENKTMRRNHSFDQLSSASGSKDPFKSDTNDLKPSEHFRSFKGKATVI